MFDMSQITLNQFVLIASVVVMVSLLLRILTADGRRAAQLLWLEAKIDAILTDAEIEFKPYESLPEMAILALQEGDRPKAISAFKALQKSFSVGNKETEHLIREIQRHATLHEQGLSVGQDHSGHARDDGGE
ncbi:MAG: hypothetical protein QGF59_23685 [Pirellulaceae bacterium]|jgi:hypothetical protein|nr:hypothetical protein [Pirellulaceae bacterium]